MWSEETEENMAINKVEWEQIHTAIRDALAQDARGKLAQLKSWSPLGAIVAIGIFALIQWNGYTIFKTHTEDSLSAINASLLILRA
jgi:cytochrome b